MNLMHRVARYTRHFQLVVCILLALLCAQASYVFAQTIPSPAATPDPATKAAQVPLPAAGGDKKLGGGQDSR